MAIEKDITSVPTKKVERTRRINCECPYSGDNSLTLHRETTWLDADGNPMFQEPWRAIHMAASDVAAMTFYRENGSSFTGLQLMQDMQVACDQIANPLEDQGGQDGEV